LLTLPIIHHPAILKLGPFRIFGHLFGPLELTGFGVAMAAAFGIAHLIAQRVLEERGDDPAIMNDVTVAALIGTIVGGKIYYAILEHSVAALFTRAGLVFWGGFIGAVLCSFAVIIWRKRSVLRIADGAAAAIAAGYAIGRTGCWAVGDDYGRVWQGGWLAVAFPEGLPPTTVRTMRTIYHASLPPGLPDDFVLGVYPTQLLEVVLGFLMFLILWRQRRSTHAAGWLFGLYCALAGVERFGVELLRAKSDIVGPFTSAQIVALGVGAIGLALLARRSGEGVIHPAES
jgi:phosphatidylglycerol:prolipoprotein diacylglycerol transferase